ncbi:MAG TPA: tetraacyldisaccharide 4'-kinase [Solimonas sp.]|nr:tetraacyldisaccharide 4'-kinase [Solimonas sp.]
MRHWLEQVWYRTTPPPLVLRPLAMLYGLLSRRVSQQRRQQAQRLPVMVIVVGNVTIGGAGKTPCVLWLVEVLQSMGRRPGILSRGYGGRGPFPRLVRAGDSAEECGDEPVLLAQRGQVPLAVAPDRLAAGRLLLQSHPEVDVLVCDDGLQHYRLERDLELCVVDGRRGFGNGWLLPAGPLREPSSRAAETALLLVNGASPLESLPHAQRFDLQIGRAVNLLSGESRALREFLPGPVHAVAGIGNPERFFDGLAALALTLQKHAFADHHAYVPADLAFADAAPVLMTEKDAVKCRAFAQPQWWAVPADLHFPAGGEARLRRLLQERLHGAETSI